MKKIFSKKFIIVVSLVLITLLLVSALPLATCADNSGARPVWILSHRCNNPGDVKKATAQGANGVEIDLRRCKDSVKEEDGEVRWVLNHDAALASSLSLKNFFKDELADSKCCLVYLDIKNVKKMTDLMDRIHQYMDKYDRGNVWFVYSVSSLSDAKYFDDIASKLRKNEGLMVDRSSNYKGVNQKFKDLKVENCWYAHGIYDENVARFYKIRASLKKAKELDGSVFKKTASWSMYSKSGIKDRLITLGCDAVVVEGGGGDYHHCGRVSGIKYAMEVLKENSSKIRIATAEDNPFVK